MRAATLALAALLAASQARAAQRPVQPPAAEFPTSVAWLNAKALTMKQFRGRRVVVVAFLNSVNLNSLRALTVLKAWDERYGLDGLSIIGVHSALYGFQRDPLALKDDLKRLGATFPIIVDDGTLWKAYANEGWPAFYLIDRRGKIVYDLLGEGDYAAFEEEMRGALADAGYKPSGAPISVDPSRESCGAATAELTLGSLAKRPHKTFDLDAAETREELGTGEMIVSSRDGETSQHGPWRREPEALRLIEQNTVRDAFVRIICRGTQIFGLLSGPPGRKPGKFFIRQDGLWLHGGNAGADVKFDEDGRSYVNVGAPRLYWLLKNPDDSMHDVMLMPVQEGSAVYGFQFADRCLPYRP